MRLRDGAENGLTGTAAVGPCTEIVSCEDLRTIRDALDHHTAVPRLSGELEARIASMCTRGRDAGLRVEELLIQIKRAWRELPGTPRFEALSHRDTRLDKVVTTLIERYFDRPSAGRTADDLRG